MGYFPRMTPGLLLLLAWTASVESFHLPKATLVSKSRLEAASGFGPLAPPPPPPPPSNNAGGGNFNRPIQWGILGAGAISNDFAKAIQFTPGAELVAIASRSGPKANAFADEHHVAKAFDSYEELICDDDVDVVYIGTVADSHFDLAKLALSHRKPTVVEKPCALSHADLSYLVQLAQEHQCFFLEGMWTRFFPAMLKMRDLIADGAIGRPVMVSGDFGWKTESLDRDHRMFAPKSGGMVLDVAMYMAQLGLAVYEGDVFFKTMAMGTTSPSNEEGVELDHTTLVSCQMDRARDGFVQFYVTADADTEERAVIQGTKGRIVIERHHAPETLTLYQENDQGRMTTQVLEYGLPKDSYAKWNHPGSIGFTHQIEEVNNCLREGDLQSPVYTWQEMLEVARLLDTIREQVGLEISSASQEEFVASEEPVLPSLPATSPSSAADPFHAPKALEEVAVVENEEPKEKKPKMPEPNFAAKPKEKIPRIPEEKLPKMPVPVGFSANPNEKKPKMPEPVGFSAKPNEKKPTIPEPMFEQDEGKKTANAQQTKKGKNHAEKESAPKDVVASEKAENEDAEFERHLEKDKEAHEELFAVVKEQLQAEKEAEEDDFSDRGPDPWDLRQRSPMQDGWPRGPPPPRFDRDLEEHARARAVVRRPGPNGVEMFDVDRGMPLGTVQSPERRVTNTPPVDSEMPPLGTVQSPNRQPPMRNLLRATNPETIVKPIRNPNQHDYIPPASRVHPLAPQDQLPPEEAVHIDTRRKKPTPGRAPRGTMMPMEMEEALDYRSPIDYQVRGDSIAKKKIQPPPQYNYEDPSLYVPMPGDQGGMPGRENQPKGRLAGAKASIPSGTSVTRNVVNTDTYTVGNQGVSAMFPPREIINDNTASASGGPRYNNQEERRRYMDSTARDDSRPVGAGTYTFQGNNAPDYRYKSPAPGTFAYGGGVLDPNHANRYSNDPPKPREPGEKVKWSSLKDGLPINKLARKKNFKTPPEPPEPRIDSE